MANGSISYYSCLTFVLQMEECQVVELKHILLSLSDTRNVTGVITQATSLWLVYETFFCEITEKNSKDPLHPFKPLFYFLPGNRHYRLTHFLFLQTPCIGVALLF